MKLVASGGICALVLLALLGCDPGEGQRFLDQEPWFRFDGQLFRLTVRGARLVSTAPVVTPGYTCPAGDAGTSEVTVFTVEALTPTPLIEIESRVESTLECASQEPFAIELTGLPIDALDVFRRCDPTATERFTNRCPEADRVESCTADSPPTACELVVEGRYRVVAWSEPLDEPRCRESGVRGLPGLGDPEACAACNAFEPDPPSPGAICDSPIAPDSANEPLLTVALRSSIPEVSQDDPSATCCDPSVVPRFVFCARPCRCRRTFIGLEPKPRSETPLPLKTDDGTLRLAVISDVESNKPRFTKFVAQARERGVDAVVSIGDLTDSGGQGGVRSMANFVRDRLTVVDGSDCDKDANGRLCCAPDQRLFPQLCNAAVQRQPFLNGLGRNETEEESFFTFFEQFGPTNAATVIGHVQLVLVDSANGTLSNAQFEWLEGVLATPRPSTIACTMAGAPPNGASDWPLASDCEGRCELCGFGNTAPLCVVPPRERSDYVCGEQNCMCIDSQSQPCPGNLQCLDLDGDGRTRCACDRDSSCGPGGRCVDGDCAPPLRLVFTHTPPFDLFGARNQAFRSRREAARLMSMLADAGVGLLFAGAINTFREISVAGVPLFITGGGGADLEAFDDTGHHWLLVTVRHAWDGPTRSDVSVEVIRLDE